MLTSSYLRQERKKFQEKCSCNCYFFQTSELIPSILPRLKFPPLRTFLINGEEIFKKTLRSVANISVVPDLMQVDSILLRKRAILFPGKCTNLQTSRFSGDHLCVYCFLLKQKSGDREKVEHSSPLTLQIQREWTPIWVTMTQSFRKNTRRSSLPIVRNFIHEEWKTNIHNYHQRRSQPFTHHHLSATQLSPTARSEGGKEGDRCARARTLAGERSWGNVGK